MDLTYYENVTTQWALKFYIKDLATMLKRIYTKYPEQIEWGSTKEILRASQANLRVLRKLRSLE